MADLTPQPEARFSVGDRVRVLTISPSGHIRAPKFCRGHEGTVIHRAPKFRFPDTSAHGGERRKEHTYHVEFASKDLWSDSDAANDSVIVDLWDSYLEAAS
jgi:nitrile hydratase